MVQIPYTYPWQPCTTLIQLVQMFCIVSTNVLYINENINKYYMKYLLICVNNISCDLVWEKKDKKNENNHENH